MVGTSSVDLRCLVMFLTMKRRGVRGGRNTMERGGDWSVLIIVIVESCHLDPVCWPVYLSCCPAVLYHLADLGSVQAPLAAASQRCDDSEHTWRAGGLLTIVSMFSLLRGRGWRLAADI